jgi:uncharacterized damage-inducible protein DinB
MVQSMPTTLTDDVCALLLRDLDGFQREMSLFPDEDSIWRTLPGVTNSAGNLALHIAGNLQYFIGAVLGASGYVRDREREFGPPSATREEILLELGRAIEVVGRVVPGLTDDQLEATFTAHSTAEHVPTRRFLLHLCTHTAFHVGQAGYLRRMLTGDVRSTNTVTASRL